MVSTVLLCNDVYHKFTMIFQLINLNTFPKSIIHLSGIGYINITLMHKRLKRLHCYKMKHFKLIYLLKPAVLYFLLEI